MTPAELCASVRGHLEEVYYGLFEWQAGTYHYTPELPEEDDRVVLDRDPRALLAEGIRRKYVLPYMMEKIGAPSSLLTPVEGVDPDLDALGFSAEAKRLVRLVDGTRNIEDLVFSSGLEALAVYHVLAALVFMGYVKVTIRGIEGVSADGTTSGDAIDRERIQDKLNHVRQLDYFQVLGIPRSATAYEVERAFTRARREFEESRFSEGVCRDLHRELLEIERVIEDAHEVLRDDSLRQSYARHLA
jgi:hypothetical protein